MSAAGFEQSARLIALQGFKAKVKKLRKDHKDITKKFDVLCDELDTVALNESYLLDVTSQLTIYLSELNLIEQKIKEISDTISHILLEISN